MRKLSFRATGATLYESILSHLSVNSDQPLADRKIKDPFPAASGSAMVSSASLMVIAPQRISSIGGKYCSIRDSTVSQMQPFAFRGTWPTLCDQPQTLALQWFRFLFFWPGTCSLKAKIP
jgi:hypothetical protein